jgi:hypothetical protein
MRAHTGHLDADLFHALRGLQTTETGNEPAHIMHARVSGREQAKTPEEATRRGRWMRTRVECGGERQRNGGKLSRQAPPMQL